MMKVALLQMQGCGMDQEAAQVKGELFCRQAAQQGADIALFPEMWNVGYDIFDEPVWQEKAITTDSPFFVHFQELAKGLNMAIALTYLGRIAQGLTDTVSILDCRGQCVLTYHKVHTCDYFASEALLVPGNDFVVSDLHTAAGTVHIGAMICFDCYFPESARLLMLQGAELVLAPNADGLGEAKHGLFRTRAYENMFGFATCNYAPPNGNGQSVAFDGMEHDLEGRSLDSCLVRAGEAEGVFLAMFDVAALRAYRKREVYGNSWRRPSQYGGLSSDYASSDVPLLRKEGRR